MSPRLRLFVLAVACALAPGLVSGASASAASLSVAVEEVAYKLEWNVTVTGQADEPSMVRVYVADAQQPCDYFAGSGPYAMVSVPAGPFSITENIRNTSGHALGTQQVVCGAILGRTGMPAATTSTPVGSELPKKTISANTNNQLDTAPSSSWRRGLSIWSMSCGDVVTNRCDMQGTGTINVSDAHRKKLGLPSTVIAKGTIKDNGEASWQLQFEASKSVVKRLRKASKLPVVFKIELAEPFARTITFAKEMLVRRGAQHYPSGLRPLYLDWDETGKRLDRRGGGGDGDGGGRGGRG